MKDDLFKILMVIKLLEEAEEQVRRRQMEEKSEESETDLTEWQTDSVNTGKLDLN